MTGAQNYTTGRGCVPVARADCACDTLPTRVQSPATATVMDPASPYPSPLAPIMLAGRQLKNRIVLHASMTTPWREPARHGKGRLEYADIYNGGPHGDSRRRVLCMLDAARAVHGTARTDVRCRHRRARRRRLPHGAQRDGCDGRKACGRQRDMTAFPEQARGKPLP